MEQSLQSNERCLADLQALRSELERLASRCASNSPAKADPRRQLQPPTIVIRGK